MFITNNKKVQVVFGTGDISVGIGCQSDRSSGVAQFTEIEPIPIGKEFITDKKTLEIDEAPVTFIFNKIESLDAVIYQLQRLRNVMSGKVSYELGADGSVVEKKL